MLLRLLESLTNGILLQSNAPGQKEDDIDYAVYSKEPSQLMKEQLGGVIGPTHRFENSIFLLDKEKMTFLEINPSGSRFPVIYTVRSIPHSQVEGLGFSLPQAVQA